MYLLTFKKADKNHLSIEANAMIMDRLRSL